MTDPSIKNCKGEIPLQLVESASVVAELLKYTNTTTYTTDQKHAVAKFLESNPLCAEEFFDHCIGTNGKDEDSKDLLITFDLSPFKPKETLKARKLIKGDEFTAFSNMVQRFVKVRSIINYEIKKNISNSHLFCQGTTTTFWFTRLPRFFLTSNGC